MNETYRVRVTGRAARFLAMLREFGHLDEGSGDELLLAAADIAGQPQPVPADLPLIRRLAAVTLFEGAAEEIEQPGTVLADDWPLLFS